MLFFYCHLRKLSVVHSNGRNEPERSIFTSLKTWMRSGHPGPWDLLVTLRVRYKIKMTKRRRFVSENMKRRVLTKWSMSGTNLRWPKSVKTQRFKKYIFWKDLGLTNRKKITCSTWHPRNSLFLKPTWISNPPRTPCAQHGSPGTIPLQRRRQGFRCYSQTRPRDRGPAGLASWLRSQGHRHACSRPVVDDSSRLFNKQINRLGFR